MLTSRVKKYGCHNYGTHTFLILLYVCCGFYSRCYKFKSEHVFTVKKIISCFISNFILCNVNVTILGLRSAILEWNGGGGGEVTNDIDFCTLLALYHINHEWMKERKLNSKCKEVEELLLSLVSQYDNSFLSTVIVLSIKHNGCNKDYLKALIYIYTYHQNIIKPEKYTEPTRQS